MRLSSIIKIKERTIVIDQKHEINDKIENDIIYKTHNWDISLKKYSDTQYYSLLCKFFISLDEFLYDCFSIKSINCRVCKHIIEYHLYGFCVQCMLQVSGKIGKHKFKKMMTSITVKYNECIGIIDEFIKHDNMIMRVIRTIFYETMT